MSHKKILIGVVGGIIIIMVLAGCGNAQLATVITSDTVVPSFTHTITPYPTSSPTRTPSPTITLSPTTTSTPKPTLTPTATPTLLGGFSGTYLTLSRTGNQYVLHQWNADGESSTQLLKLPDFSFIHWSPVGDRFAYTTCESVDVGGNRKESLCNVTIFNTDGSASFDLNLQSYRSIDWSPDGKSLVYSAYAEHGQPDIFIINVDTQEVTQLTNTLAKDKEPIFSPDGSKILWYEVVDGQAIMYIINVDGTDRYLFGYGAVYDWSPDGTQIVYSVLGGDLGLTSVDRTKNLRLTRDSTTPYDCCPKFSPNGKYISYESFTLLGPNQSDPDEGHYLYIVSSHTDQQPILVGTGSNETWSPDGRMILFYGWPSNEQTNPPRYYAYSIEENRHTLLTDHASGMVEGYWQPNAEPESFVDNSVFLASTPTATPTPIPTWEAFNTPPLYDDFSGEDLDRDLWLPSTLPQGFSYKQTDGLIILKSESAQEAIGFDLQLKSSIGYLKDITAFEAKLQLKSDSQGDFGFVKIGLDTEELENHWWVQCTLGRDLRERQPVFICDVSQWKDNRVVSEFETEEIKIIFDRWYTVRIETNPALGAFQFYLDGEIVGTYSPQRAAELLEMYMKPTVGIWMYEDVSLTAYVDDVRISKE